MIGGASHMIDRVDQKVVILMGREEKNESKKNTNI